MKRQGKVGRTRTNKGRRAEKSRAELWERGGKEPKYHRDQGCKNPPGARRPTRERKEKKRKGKRPPLPPLLSLSFFLPLVPCNELPGLAWLSPSIPAGKTTHHAGGEKKKEDSGRRREAKPDLLLCGLGLSPKNGRT